mgnify:CR=1 FL=1
MAVAVPDRFVQWFRAAAPYIHAFRGRTFVIAFGGEVMAEARFVGLNHDLNLLAALGVGIAGSSFSVQVWLNMSASSLSTITIVRFIII